MDTSPPQTLARLGGVATWAELREHQPARALRRALREGVLVKGARGRYHGPEVAEHRVVAHAFTATVSHLSAAQHHGWKVKAAPDLPQVTVPRHRKMSKELRARADIHFADLGPSDHKSGVTTKVRTVVDCARSLSFDAALAVADSALRGGVSLAALTKAAAEVRGPGAVRVRRVIGAADARAANPFESVLRALAIEVGFEGLVPQLQIADTGIFAVVDLGDPVRRVVLEADSFAHHGQRQGLRRDCRRYTEFAILKWSVLRFSHEDVMFEQDWTRWALGAWLAQDGGLAVPSPPRLAA